MAFLGIEVKSLPLCLVKEGKKACVMDVGTGGTCRRVLETTGVYFMGPKVEPVSCAICIVDGSCPREITSETFIESYSAQRMTSPGDYRAVLKNIRELIG